MGALGQDFIYALRIFRKRPGFAVAAVLTLALGIAANTTIFSLINAVLLRSLPFPQADRLVSLWTAYPASDGQRDIFSPANYLDVAARASTLEAAGGYDTISFTLAGAGDPEFIPGVRMSASMSRVLGVAPQVGRWFTAEEDRAGAAVVLLSDAIWRTRFGGDSGVLSRTLTLNGRGFVVIGVLPAGVAFPSRLTQIYSPVSFNQDDLASRGNVFLNVAARLRAGVNLAQSEAELRTIAATLGREYPLDAGIKMGAIPLQESIIGNVRGILVMLWAAVAFLLAVACANVANLLLAHAAVRSREFALRRSLGATHARLIRQLLTESATLAGLGGVAGLTLAAWAVPMIAARLPQSFPNLRAVSLDPQVLWFTLAISLATGVLFGLAPAAGSARGNPAGALRAGGAGGRSSRRLGRLLVVGEVAAVLVLLVGAGLVLRSLQRLSRVDPGFDPRGVVAWQMFLPSSRYPNAPAQRAFYRTVLERVERLPGVQAAGFAQPLPFGPIDIVADTGFAIAGRPPISPDQQPQALITRANPTYFAAMGIPVKRGRVFTSADGEASNAVVISEALAKRYFAGEDPVGQRLLLGNRRLETQIVGVVGDVKHINLQNDARPEFYLPLARFTPGAAGLVVRASGPAAPMIPPIEQSVWSIDNALAGNLAAPVDALLYASLAPARLAAVLLAVFAGTALVLGLIGVYGVLSYSVKRATREIGVRLALGASQAQVVKLVLGEALGLTASGVAVGVVAALLLARYMKTLLYGVSEFDPWIYAAVTVGVVCAALAASYPPARRAARIDPASSLRAE
jgi:putative ABC transport system permease protein